MKPFSYDRWYRTIVSDTEPLSLIQNHYLWYRTIISDTEPLSLIQNHYLWYRTIISITEPLSLIQNHYLWYRTIKYSQSCLKLSLNCTNTIFVVRQNMSCSMRKAVMLLLMYKLLPLKHLKHSIQLIIQSVSNFH